MKNLKIIVNIKQNIEVFKNCDLVVCGKHGQDTDLSSKLHNLFVLTNGFVFSVDLQRQETLSYYDLNDYFCGQEIPKAVSMWYRDIYDALYISFESGEIILLVRDQLSGRPTCRRSHLMDNTLKKIVWSPDEELVVVISDSDCVYLMNFEFFILSEIDIFDSNIGEKALVNVGWGKKETQFHGSLGKKAAISTPLTVNPDVSQNNSIQITWRGDCDLFAIGYWCTAKNMRRVKIFDSEGVLQCVSEDIPGLAEPIFWKPQGSLITLVQQLPNKNLIAFMEKNGLKHGDFSLPDNIKVNKICWNETSTILCTVCLNKELLHEEVMLWTTGNYHWYLKQKFKLDSPLIQIWWDKERPKRLYILCKNGDFHISEWEFIVQNSYNSIMGEQSHVAVIDNNNILLSSFREALIPPPMCSYNLKCPESVNSLLFAPISGVNSAAPVMLGAVLSNGTLAFFDNFELDPKIYSVTGLVNNGVQKIINFSVAHWELLTPHTLIFCIPIDNKTHLHHIDIEDGGINLKHVEVFIGNVMTCTRSSTRLLIQMTDGKLFNYYPEERAISEKDFMLPEPCYEIKCHNTGIYSVSEWSRLYMNQTQINLPSISGKVTSFLLKDPYVLVTTSSHKLVILNFNGTECEEISNRKLDRGSKLVSSCGNCVILQAPRGNLETIQPRALTVLTIGQLIDSTDYHNALSLMRKQRIDLNLIIDHNQNLFFKQISSFINQVDPQWLTLLITELSNDDVTKTLYQSYYKNKHSNTDNLNGTKVESVCQSLLTAMSCSERKNKFTFSMLSALVKLGQMGKAIKLADSEQSLQHLMFIVDTNKLYLEALGTHDLQAALKIAEKSQKDPKEYIPYLNSLKSMESNYMKFTIDKTLNRPKTAIAHLINCNSEYDEECYSYIKEHGLYSTALNLLRQYPERVSIVASMYGEFLYKQRHYEESGFMFLRGRNRENAIQSFIKSGNWRQCMIVVLQADYSSERQKSIADDVFNMLKSSHKYAEAAEVCLEWLSDVHVAVGLYCLASCWKEAIYAAQKYKKTELIAEIKESVLESAHTLSNDIHGKHARMTKYIERLKVVRIEKQNRPAFTYDDFNDTASDASSTSSVRTKSSQSRSSKNTRKTKRKFWSLKEGNPREEEALIAELTQDFQHAEKLIGEVNLTCSAMLYFEEDQQASNLQSAMEEWLHYIERAEKIIWPKDPEADELQRCDHKFKYPPDISIPSGWKFDMLYTSATTNI